MSRVRRGPKGRRRRNKILKLAKGFHFDRRRKFKHAHHTVIRALQFQYISRRLIKRDMRSLWIQRIGAATRSLGTSYSKFMGAMGKAGMEINRKMLAELAATDMNGFQKVYETVMK
jgi:large subunit ribosomal protein L20